jgi:hypothetical protein
MIVKKVGLDLPEVISERREGAVVGMLEEDVELCAVELESVDLAVLKFEHSDERFGCEESRAGAAEAVICAKRPIRLSPVLERVRGNLNVCFASHHALGVRKRVLRRRLATGETALWHSSASGRNAASSMR